MFVGYAFFVRMRLRVPWVEIGVYFRVFEFNQVVGSKAVSLRMEPPGVIWDA